MAVRGEFSYQVSDWITYRDKFVTNGERLGTVITLTNLTYNE